MTNPEFWWHQVTKRGMDPLGHVLDLRPVLKLFDCVFETIIFSVIDMLLLECPNETFNDPIFCLAASVWHTKLSCSWKYFCIDWRGILAALIRMMDLRWWTSRKCFHQSWYGQLFIQASSQMPAFHAPWISSKNDRQINESKTQSNVSDVWDPDLVKVCNVQVFDQIRISRMTVLAVCCWNWYTTHATAVFKLF